MSDSEKADATNRRKPQSLDAAVNAFAASRIKRLDPKKIVEGLRKEGIGNLEQLAGAISSISALDPEDLICFPYYVYRRRNPLFEEDLRHDLEQFEQFAKRQIG